jgi:hypothetical protein
VEVVEQKSKKKVKKLYERAPYKNLRFLISEISTLYCSMEFEGNYLGIL